MPSKSLMDGGRKLGLLNFSGSTKLVEIAAHAGFDFIIIDTEHTVTSWENVDHMIMAARANSLPVLVRVGKPDELEILRALDCGADGIVVSHVTSAEVARQAAAASYYPPSGVRGMCPAIRPARYGEMPWHEHAEASNRRIMLICLIEDVPGLENVEAICGVEGVDAVWCGSGDLSSSLGIHHSGLEHPRMREAMARIRDACAANGKTFMATAGSKPTPEYVSELWAFGAPLVSLAPDLMLVRNAFSDAVKRLKGPRD